MLQRQHVSPDCWSSVLGQRELLAEAGVRVAMTEVCETPAHAVAAADRLGYPVVLKVQHPDLSHKSDVGGVELGDCRMLKRVRLATDRLLALAPGATVLVQQQHQGLELVVGGIGTRVSARW